MPTLADLLKIKHLIWQTTKIDVRGTLMHIVGRVSTIQTMDDLRARKLSDMDLNIIRELYDSIRRVEWTDGRVELESRQWMTGMIRTGQLLNDPVSMQ